MALRQAIASERGFAEDIKLPVLTKVMLAERFSTDFYDQLGRLVTASPNGKVVALSHLEAIVAPQGEAAPATTGKGRGETAPSEVDEWVKNDWVVAWAKIEPRIGEIDLRPYVFVTRDKRSYYVGAPMVGHLDALVERLMGQSMVVQAASAEIEKLSDPESQQVFDELKARVIQSEKLNLEPRGVKGLVALARMKPNLQGAMLQFLKDLPAENLGAWAATSCASAFTGSEMRASYDRILQGWQKDSKNPTLKTAADMALKVK
jgi:hypothetical protein